MIDLDSRRAILWLCSYTMATGCAIVVGPATCLNSISTDLGIASEIERGLFLGLPFWGLGAVSLFSGLIAERIGYRKLLVSAALVQVIGMVLLATAQTKLQAFTGSLVTGLGRGFPAAPMTALVCALYPENRTGIANILHGFFYIGMVAMSAVVLLLVMSGTDWRAVFFVFSATVGLFGIGALIVRFPPAAPPVQAARTSLGDLVRYPVFLWIASAIFFSGVTEIGPSVWLPYFIQLASGSSQELAVLSLLLLGITMALGRFTCARLVSKVGVRAVFSACGMVSAFSIGMAALPVSTLFTVFWLTVLGLAITVSFPTVVAYAGDRFPAANTSMFAVLNFMAIAGGIAGPTIIGFAADAFGLRLAMGTLALAPLLLLLSLRQTFRLAGDGTDSVAS